MNMPWSKLEGPAKWLVVFITILLVSSGLCGLQMLIANGGQGNVGGLIPVFIVLGFFEIGAMAISAFGAVLMLIVWLISLVRRGSADHDDSR
jgi:hypothetical protein